MEFNQEISEKDKKIFFKGLRNDNYLILSINEFLRSNLNSDNEKYLDRSPDRTRILISNLVKDLNSEKMTQLLKIYKDLKIKEVEKLIDCIANSEKQEYQIQHEEKQISLKDYFELEIKENQSS